MTIEEAIRILTIATDNADLSVAVNNSENYFGKLNEACQLAADEVHKRQWISVKDRLPEICQDVLVYCKNTQRVTIGRFAHWYDNDGWDIVGTKGRFNDIVTHWMPMPEPPKEGEENAG